LKDILSKIDLRVGSVLFLFFLGLTFSFLLVRKCEEKKAFGYDLIILFLAKASFINIKGTNG
jgi:hypothetical protein